MSLSIEKKIYLGLAKPGTGGTPINNQDISVTINGTYTADEGYTGLGTVNVNVPNPSTGTKSITANGIYDVTNYASADVQVPTTAPAYYIDKTVNASGVMLPGSHLMSFNGVTKINNYALCYSYIQNQNISGAVDMSDVVCISIQGCYGAFSGCTYITSVDLSSLETVDGVNGCKEMFKQCTGLTSINLSALKTISGADGCSNMFQQCPGLTGHIDLSSLETISVANGCNNMFANCTGITSVDLSSLKDLYSDFGSRALANMFSNCTALTSANVGSLAYIQKNNHCEYMFNGCSNLTTVNLGSLLAIGGSNACSSMFRNCTSLPSIDLSSLVVISSQNAANNMFDGCTNLASVDISHLTSIYGSNAMQYMFKGCTSLTELRFSGLIYSNTNFNNALAYMLNGVTGCTVHFPSDWQTTMSSWSNVTSGFGGTSTTVLFDLPPVTTLDLSYIVELFDNNIFQSLCSGYSITGVNLSSLKTISGAMACQYMCSSNTNLTTVDVSSLRTVSGTSGCNGMFSNCSGITNINLSSLETISGLSGCQYMFQNCTGLTSINLSSLTNVTTTNGCASMLYGCTSLTDIKIPSLKNVYNNQVFGNMLGNTTGCTVHFPSNMSSYNFNVGGTNTTVLYDLPATVTLTGADAKTYERNPKYDTATALGWYEVGTDRFTTQYYTSGTTDPAVGDTIYSDSACTNAVTTIDSIA